MMMESLTMVGFNSGVVTKIFPIQICLLKGQKVSWQNVFRCHLLHFYSDCHEAIGRFGLEAIF
jgi:hypothetical protein